MTAEVQGKNYSSYHLSAEQILMEEQEVEAAQADPRAFEPLYTRYFRSIAGYVHHRVDNKELAFEITAQVFYKALSHLPTYTSRGVPFSAWLFRIAANELNQWFRKTKSQRLLCMDLQGLHDIKSETLETNSAETDAQLFEAIQQLEEDEIELINMRFFEKRSFKEISTIIQTSESACKMRVYRILEKLKTLLTDLIRPLQ